MKKIKSISALSLVLFAQINIFSQNYFALKHHSEMKLEKDHKKIIASDQAKQAISRIGNNIRLVLQKVLLKIFTKVQEIFFQSFNMVRKFIGRINSDYSKFRLLWFGCKEEFMLLILHC